MVEYNLSFFLKDNPTSFCLALIYKIYIYRIYIQSLNSQLEVVLDTSNHMMYRALENFALSASVAE